MAFLEILANSFVSFVSFFGRGGINHTGGLINIKESTIIEIVIATDVIEGGIECSICLSLYNLEDSALMLICGHYFHADCYREWEFTCIKENRVVSCPICRG